MTKLTIIIPTFNEEENQFFKSNLQTLSQLDEVEIIVSDGGSTDKTIELCENYRVKTMLNKTTSRADRINIAIPKVSSENILIHHPRSKIELAGIQFLIENGPLNYWGGFIHQFDNEHPVLKFTSWYSNNIRSRYGIVYLDHCIFLSKGMASQVFPLPSVDIFEDTILSKRLRNRFKRPKLLKFKVTTSAIRFQQNGMFHQGLLNQWLKVKYFMGFKHREMNTQYENNTNLNAKYDSQYDSQYDEKSKK